MEDSYIQFTVSISKLNKLVQKIKSLEMSKFGLQPIHASCAYNLSKHSGGLTAKELCEILLEDKAAISRALKTLHEKKYVEYEPRGRNEIVRLTDEGQKFADVIIGKIKSAVKAGRANLTDEQRKYFYDSLSDISNNLIEYYQKLLQSGDEQ